MKRNLHQISRLLIGIGLVLLPLIMFAQTPCSNSVSFVIFLNHLPIGLGSEYAFCEAYLVDSLPNKNNLVNFNKSSPLPMYESVVTYNNNITDIAKMYLILQISYEGNQYTIPFRSGILKNSPITAIYINTEEGNYTYQYYSGIIAGGSTYSYPIEKYLEQHQYPKGFRINSKDERNKLRKKALYRKLHKRLQKMQEY